MNLYSLIIQSNNKKKVMVILVMNIIIILIAIATCLIFKEDSLQVNNIKITSMNNTTVLSFNIINLDSKDFRGQYSILIKDVKSDNIIAQGKGELFVPSKMNQTIESIPNVFISGLWHAYTMPGAIPIIEIFIKDDKGNQVFTLREQITV